MLFLVVTFGTLGLVATLWFVFEVFLPLWNEQRPFVLWRMFRLRMRLAKVRDEVTKASILREIEGTKKEASRLY